MFKQFSHAQLLPLSKTKMKSVKKSEKSVLGEIYFYNATATKLLIRVRKVQSLSGCGFLVFTGVPHI